MTPTNTNAFFTHWCGRIRRSRSRGSLRGGGGAGEPWGGGLGPGGGRGAGRRPRERLLGGSGGDRAGGESRERGQAAHEPRGRAARARREAQERQQRIAVRKGAVEVEYRQDRTLGRRPDRCLGHVRQGNQAM